MITVSTLEAEATLLEEEKLKLQEELTAEEYQLYLENLAEYMRVKLQLEDHMARFTIAGDVFHKLYNNIPNKDLYFKNLDEAGKEALLVELEAELLLRDAEEVDKESIQAAEKLLKETDWYVIRLQETGKPIPQEIIDQRAAARIAADKS